MANTIILTVIGSDRPGLVDDLATMVNKHGGNWLESRMTRLSSNFAGIVRVSVPEANHKALEGDIQSLGCANCQLIIEQEIKAGSDETLRELSLEIIGPDHPGIVQDISHALAEKKIGINEISTDCQDGAMSSERIFSAEINIAIPTSMPVDSIREQLEELANQLFVDITMDDLQGTVTRI